MCVRKESNTTTSPLPPDKAKAPLSGTDPVLLPKIMRHRHSGIVGGSGGIAKTEPLTAIRMDNVRVELHRGFMFVRLLS